MWTQQREPKAVCISDIHFRPDNLELASTAVSAALYKARRLSVPLVVAGDLLDGKAIVRAECINALIGLFEDADPGEVYIIPGNHCKINEKSEDHALNFLSPYCSVVGVPAYVHDLESWLVPYQSDLLVLKEVLKAIPQGGRIICHQGVQAAYMGHYTQDQTSLPKEAFADYRVISGHYHRAQDIKCGRPRKGAVGLFSYLGSPFTHTFGEASDGPKGYAVLYSDGLLERVPLNLRKHVVLERSIGNLYDPVDGVDAQDLVWLKITGPKRELDKLQKVEIGHRLLGRSDFRLDKICTDGPNVAEVQAHKMTYAEVMDSLVDQNRPGKAKTLKALWRTLS